MSVKLSVNLNAVAVLRNRRNLPWPNLKELGRLALQAGANGLTLHPRPDQRHIRYSDLPEIASLLKTDFKTCEFNLEGFPTSLFFDQVERNRPHQVTLVPDAPEQSTSDHGWDFIGSSKKLTSCVRRFKDLGVRVSLFANPDSLGLQAAADTGADRVEFYTGSYGACYDCPEESLRQLEKLYHASMCARSLGLGVNAGHDLTVKNLLPLLKKIPFISEVSIGHALIADSLEFGLPFATQRFLKLCCACSDILGIKE